MDKGALAKSIKHADLMKNVLLAIKNDEVSARKCGTITRSARCDTPVKQSIFPYK